MSTTRTHDDSTTDVDARLASSSVVVLSGGRSSEREVSLKTGAAVARALSASADRRGPARVSEIEILADGRWRTPTGVRAPADVLSSTDPTTVWFLGLHGGEGEDGTIQGLLTALGFVHTGSGVGASALCMSKLWTRDVLRAAGLTVAPGLCVRAHDWRERRGAILAEVAALGTSGFAVKPDRGGSSVATFLVATAAEVEGAIERVLATGDRAIVEARIVGAETTCGVMGNELDALRALTPVEIVPKDGRFFDYEEKYSASGAAEHCPPITISRETCELVRADAVRAFTAAGCRGYARIDFMIPRTNTGPNRTSAEGHPVVLEINTLPGMTDRSLLPQAAAEAGMSFRDLCLEILRLALDRPRS